MDNLLLHFLLPTFDGSIHAFLQLSFAAIFLASVLLAIVLVRRQARPEHWARQLAGSDETDARGLTHTTIDELAAAVATPAERWADILPSMLLVFGLLGTFIGLGLALTEAAGVLGPGNDALSGLTPIMDSLGSKFKTSTWGILAFLLLKVWFMLEPYEEPRCAWAAREIRRQAALEQTRQQKESADQRQQLIDAVERSGASRHAEELVQAAQKQYEVSESQLKRLGQLDVTLVAMRKQQAGLMQHGEAQLLRLSEMAFDSAANRTAMDDFVGSVSKNMTTMATAANKMSDAADAAGTASGELGAVIADFRETMATVLGNVKADLGATMERMSGTFSENMRKMSSGLTDATTGIRTAIEEMSSGLEGTVTTLEEASQNSVARQNVAQATFAASGDALTGSIGMIGEVVRDLGASIKLSLTSVGESNRRLANFQQEFSASNKNVTEVVAQIGRLVAGIEGQHGLDEQSVLLQHRQLTESTQLNKRLDLITASLDALAASRKGDLGQAEAERVAETLGRIEVTLGKLAQRRGGMRGSDPLAA